MIAIPASFGLRAPVFVLGKRIGDERVAAWP
jgi:hypothetical protein